MASENPASTPLNRSAPIAECSQDCETNVYECKADFDKFPHCVCKAMRTARCNQAAKNTGDAMAKKNSYV
eukprot:8123921-Karenia_brevis.AAC.1